MSKNLIVLFIIILLIVGGFGIYTYDQSNQAKKEVEEKNLKLESNDALISELKENIQEKEKQVDELKANLAKGEKDLEKEYADKLSELTEEKAKLEVLLAEKERIWLDKEKEKQQLIIKLEKEVAGYKESISKLDNELVNLKEEIAQLTKEERDLEKEYADKLSELTEEKAKLEVLLTEKEETIKTIGRQKEESEQIVFSKDELVSELKENIQEKEKQIEELKASLTREEKDLEKEYAIKVSELMEEKGQLGALLIEQEGILKTKDREKEELISKLENCNNQINELKVKLVQQEIEEKDYVAELSALTEEKNKLESQFKIYQDLLSEKEDTIVLIKQKNEESEKNIIEKDKTIAELSEGIRGYEDQIKEISEQAAKEKEKEIEKETEYSNKLSLLSEEKSKLETQLKVSQELLSEKESIFTALKQQNEESEKNIVQKDKAIAELSESIKGYENLVNEIQEQMAQEGKEKAAEYADRLALLKEGKDRIEAKLAEAIKKSIPDYYEVKKGDSLWKIAEIFYNAGEKWIRIFEANSDKIKNPSIIYPYQRFTVPKE
ncbi:Chromosome partition protein Smc [subsurface metagenome]